MTAERAAIEEWLRQWGIHNDGEIAALLDDMERLCLDAFAKGYATGRGDRAANQPEPTRGAEECKGKSDDRWLCETHPGGYFTGGRRVCTLAATPTPDGTEG